jgi:hypothetical protein
LVATDSELDDAALAQDLVIREACSRLPGGHGVEREDADGAVLLGAGSMEPRGSATAFHIEEGRRSRGALGLGRVEAEAREETRRREELAESRRCGLRAARPREPKG